MPEFPIIATDRLGVIEMCGLPDWGTLAHFESSAREMLADRGFALRVVETEFGGPTTVSGGTLHADAQRESDTPDQPRATFIATADTHLATVLREFATVAFFVDSTDDPATLFDRDYVPRLVSCDFRASVQGSWRSAGAWPW